MPNQSIVRFLCRQYPNRFSCVWEGVCICVCVSHVSPGGNDPFCTCCHTMSQGGDNILPLSYRINLCYAGIQLERNTN